MAAHLATCLAFIVLCYSWWGCCQFHHPEGQGFCLGVRTPFCMILADVSSHVSTGSHLYPYCSCSSALALADAVQGHLRLNVCFMLSSTGRWTSLSMSMGRPRMGPRCPRNSASGTGRRSAGPPLKHLWTRTSPWEGFPLTQGSATTRQTPPPLWSPTLWTARKTTGRSPPAHKPLDLPMCNMVTCSAYRS